ncbi:MAG: hypothetical protein ABIT37_04140 [Luteolibacter sp.]
MVKLKHTFLALAGLTLVSCMAPKAVVVAEPTAKPKKEEKTPEPEVAETALPTAPDDGLRVGNMLDLPGEGEFRPTNPSATKVGTEAGPVISRPPMEPPSRTKPKGDANGGQR